MTASSLSRSEKLKGEVFHRPSSVNKNQRGLMGAHQVGYHVQCLRPAFHEKQLSPTPASATHLPGRLFGRGQRSQSGSQVCYLQIQTYYALRVAQSLL